MTLTPGVHEDVSAADYHATRLIGTTPVFGSHDLIDAAKLSPFAWRHRTQRSSAAMAFGSAVHAAILEPERYAAEYVTSPYPDRRSKAAREWWVETEGRGLSVISDADATRVGAIRDRIASHDGASALLDGARTEVTVIHGYAGHYARIRIDALPRATRVGAVVDLKSANDVSPSEFSRSMARYGYDQQAAWYLDVARDAGILIGQFLWVVAGTQPPHEVAIYACHESALEIGREKNRRAVETLVRCYREDRWPGWQEGSEPMWIELPAWESYRHEERMAAREI